MNRPRQAENLQMPLISVVIPSYNTSSTIERAIRSILSAQCVDTEIVVVDDGSKDSSLELLHTLASSIPTLRVSTHPGGSNKGIAATRNLGIRLARGKYVAFLDADDEFLPNRFKACVAAFAADPALDAVSEPYELIHVSGKRSEAMRSDKSSRLTPATADQLFDLALHEGRMPHTTSITVRHTALMQIGGFPETLRYCLEKPLWLKLYSRYRVIECGEEPVARYYLHDNSTCARHEDEAAFRWEDALAYIDVHRWMRANDVSPQRIRPVRARILGKYLHYTTYARTLRWRFWQDIWLPGWQVLAEIPGEALNRRFWTASLRLWIGLPMRPVQLEKSK